MADGEFATYRDRLVREYAQERVLAGNWTAEEAEAKSAAQVDELLPQGLGTPGMLLRIAEATDGDGAGRRVGLVWLALRHLPDGTQGQARSYDATARPRPVSTSSGTTRWPSACTRRPATR
jgi:hypothetical protein